MSKDIDSRSEASKTHIERRMVPRYTFVASSEFEDVSTLRKTVGSVEEISRNGCRVETMNELPEGTTVNLRIVRERETFETKAEVIYVIERRGMGIIFQDTPKDQLEILDSWLAERASVVAVL